MKTRVQKGTQGKLIIQDWDVLETYPDEPILYILTERQAAALLAICEYLHWMTRYKNPPSKDIIDAFASETEFNLMNPITCAMLKECLQPLFDETRQQIVQQLQSGLTSPFVPGEPLPEDELNRDLAGAYNPTCDLEILCAQVIAVNEYLIQLIIDALEIMAQQTGELNLASVIAEITGLDELSIDAMVDYVRLLRDGIALNFEAQITEEYKDEIRCALYCRCMDDCAISVEDIYKVFEKRVLNYFDTPGDIFATLQDLMTYLVQQELDGTIVADALLFLVAGTGKLGTSFFGDIGTKPLEVILAQAADVGENDCGIDCVCPTEITYYLNPLDEDLTVDAFGEIFPSNYVSVNSPFEVTLTLPAAKHFLHVAIEVATFEPVTYSAIINAYSTPIPDSYPGFGVGHTSEVDLNQTSTQMIIQCSHLYLIHHITVTYE